MRCTRRGARASRRRQLHIQIVGLFSIIAAAPALLMAWVGSVALERSLNPSFMQDGRGFVQNTIDAARLFREAQCKSLLQEATLTASISIAPNSCTRSTGRCFASFSVPAPVFLALPPPRLMKTDGSILEKVDTGASSATRSRGRRRAISVTLEKMSPCVSSSMKDELSSPSAR